MKLQLQSKTEEAGPKLAVTVEWVNNCYKRDKIHERITSCVGST